MVFFKDFNKTANDILKSKNFAFFRSLEIKTDQKNNFSWSAKTSMQEGKNTSKSEIVFEQKEQGLGKLKCTFKNPEDMILEASTKELAPLTEVKFKVEHTKVEGSAQYDMDNMSGKMTVVSGKDLSCTPTVSFQTGDFTLGASAVLSESGLNDYSAGMLYVSGSNQRLSVQGKKQFNELTIAGYLDRSEVGKVCAQINVKDVQTTPVVDVEFGGLYTLDAACADLRWKCDLTKSQLSTVYEYKFAPSIKGKFGSGYNFASNSHCGVNWKLEFCA